MSDATLGRVPPFPEQGTQEEKALVEYMARQMARDAHDRSNLTHLTHQGDVADLKVAFGTPLVISTPMGHCYVPSEGAPLWQYYHQPARSALALLRSILAKGDDQGSS